MEKVICIVGPTGVGKTKLSIELAKYLNTEIINGDAIQVFREVNILSAKVTKEEMSNIKHYLIDLNEIDEYYDVASFKKDASKLISDLNKRNIIPIVVGGSGLYLKALLYDYDFINVSKRDDDFLSKYQDYTNEQLYEHLTKIDPDAASILHQNNRKRVLRAIEIYETSGSIKTEHLNKQSHTMIYDALVLGLNVERNVLYNKINQRVIKMMEDGLYEEVKSLYDKYHPSTYQALTAIGYKEWIPYFNNEIDLNETIEKIQQNSRRYAKKQMTWFKNQMDVVWINTNYDNFNITIEDAKNVVEEWLNAKNTV